jgi:NAD(P)-dependent dehydrogenase (short-subunit alcohol dehydrogenase family)
MNTKQCGVILFLNTARNCQGTHVKVNAVHPGVIRTGLGESAEGGLFVNCLLRLIKRLWKDPADGAIGPVWLGTSPETADLHGKYFDCLTEVSVSPAVADPAVQNDWKIWTSDFLKAKSRL